MPAGSFVTSISAHQNIGQSVRDSFSGKQLPAAQHLPQHNANGKRFAVLMAAEKPGDQKQSNKLTVLPNFFTELRRRGRSAPVNSGSTL